LKRTKIAILALATAALTVASASSAFATKPDASGSHKVGICHRTGSDKNPYVYITIDVAAIPAHLGSDAHPEKDGRADMGPYASGENASCDVGYEGGGYGGGEDYVGVPA
jgi:hypothetical protein